VGHISKGLQVEPVEKNLTGKAKRNRMVGRETHRRAGTIRKKKDSLRSIGQKIMKWGYKN